MASASTRSWRLIKGMSSIMRPTQPQALGTSKRLLNRPLSKQTRWQSTRPNPDPTPKLGSPEPAQTLSQRMKHLSREYGWSALGVYLALSFVDFPFCFLAVRWLGAERIGRYEHAVIGSLWHLLEIPFPNLRPDAVEEGPDIEPGAREGHVDGKKDEASLWTQLVLAYAVHKSLIFFRVPLTAAVTPRVVKTLRSWGWDMARKKAPPL